MTSTLAAVSQSQSLAAIRNFVRASISCITFARGLCGDSSYETRPFLGIELKHMVPTSTEAITISEWIEKGAFDALNKNYLKEMALCVHNADCTEQLESYAFSFSYTADGQRACMTLNSTQHSEKDGAVVRRTKRRCSKEEVQEALSAILNRLLEMVESLPPLVSERVVTMRLTYYDEITPEAYQPPCFSPASERMVRFYREEQKLGVDVGSMDTTCATAQCDSNTHRASAAVTPGAASGATASGQEDTFVTDVSAPSTWTEEAGRGGGSSTAAVSTRRGAVSTLSAASSRRRGGAPHARAGSTAPVDTFADRTQHTSAASPRRYDESGGGGVLHPDDLVNFTSSLYQLASKSQPLRATEVAYLLLVSLAFSRCAPSLGGRGRLTYAELEDYLRESCAVDITVEAAAATMHKLAADGYLQNEQDGRASAGGKASGRRSKAPRLSSGAAAGAEKESAAASGAAADGALAEWVMATDPPIAVVDAILGRRQVVDLLSPDTHVALTKLRAVMERQAKAAPAAAQTLKTQRNAPRMSCADTRKRRKNVA